MAECHQDLGEYLEALRLYQGLMQRNRGTIETLIACERIVQLQKLGVEIADLLSIDGLREVTRAARETLLLAQADLARMDPKDPDFQGQTVWSWQVWQQWISREQQRLGPPSGPATKTSRIE
jgi:hypothetical protein